MDAMQSDLAVQDDVRTIRARPILSLKRKSGAPKVEDVPPEPPENVKNPVTLVDMIRVLEFYFPKCFNWSNPRPLKVGIHQDVYEANVIPSRLLKVVLRKYAMSQAYQKSLKEGVFRVDLNGHLTTKVSDIEAKDAVANRKKYHQEIKKRTAERLYKEARRKKMASTNC